MSEVIALKTRKPIKRKIKTATVAKPVSARVAKRNRKAGYAGIAYAAIATCGMALSLSHQAHGVASSTDANTWESWSMALMIDAGLVAAKLTPYICRSASERARIERYAKPLAMTALALTAWFNACGFSGFEPVGYLRLAVCVALGAAVPAMIFALSQVASTLILTDD